MIDGEIYVRNGSNKAIFAYRETQESSISLTHYAAVVNDSTVYVCGVDGSTGRLCRDTVRDATSDEVDVFTNKLHERGFHYNKANKKVIRISTGELI